MSCSRVLLWAIHDGYTDQAGIFDDEQCAITPKRSVSQHFPQALSVIELNTPDNCSPTDGQLPIIYLRLPREYDSPNSHRSVARPTV
jgi:hypothetical protein